MTLDLKPIGRGSWSVLKVELTGKRASPLMFAVGGRLVLGGITFRICRVSA